MARHCHFCLHSYTAVVHMGWVSVEGCTPYPPFTDHADAPLLCHHNRFPTMLHHYTINN